MTYADVAELFGQAFTRKTDLDGNPAGFEIHWEDDSATIRLGASVEVVLAADLELLEAIDPDARQVSSGPFYGRGVVIAYLWEPVTRSLILIGAGAAGHEAYGAVSLALNWIW